MITANINVVDRFPQLEDKIERVLVQSLDAGAREAAQTARTIASRRRKTGKMADFRPIAAAGTEDGYASGIRNHPDAWYDIFHNYGTSGRRTRKLKKATIAARERPSGQARQQRFGRNQGIEPLGFFEAARRDGRREVLRYLESNL